MCLWNSSATYNSSVLPEEMLASLLSFFFSLCSVPTLEVPTWSHFRWSCCPLVCCVHRTTLHLHNTGHRLQSLPLCWPHKLCWSFTLFLYGASLSFQNILLWFVGQSTSCIRYLSLPIYYWFSKMWSCISCIINDEIANIHPYDQFLTT